MIQFERETWSGLEIALRREWLETNGLGGFASSTIIGLNTRRYHGLLVAATRPPVGRLVLLSKVEETLIIDRKRFDLSANRYPDLIHPLKSVPQRVHPNSRHNLALLRPARSGGL
jgi:glycogen debranching enzyme